MRSKIKEVLKDGLIVKTCQGFIIISFIYLAVIILMWRNLPPELPLYYSLPRSTEQLGTSYELLLLPIFSVLIFLIHFILAVFIHTRVKLAARLILIIALIASLTMLLTFVKIVLLIS